MHDPTIPRKGRNAASRSVAYPTIGWLVKYGDEVVLTDRRGNKWAQSQFRMVHGWGGKHDGVQRSPRPYVYSPDGATVLTEGDQGLVVFLHGDPDAPVFLPGGRSVAAPDELLPARSHQGDPNKLVMRQAVIPEGTDAPTSFFDIETDPDGPSATLRIRPTAGPDLQIVLNKATGQVQIDQGGARKKLVTEDLLLDLATALTEIATAVKGLAGPTATPETDQLVIGMALGVEYLTTRLTSE